MKKGHSAQETKLAIESIVNGLTLQKEKIVGKFQSNKIIKEIWDFKFLITKFYIYLLPGVACDEGSNYTSLFGQAADQVPLRILNIKYLYLNSN